jgi:flagellar hook-associated protein 1 FlgK
VDYLANLSSKIGGTLRAAKDTFTFEEETMGILEKQRESVSGVSIDEEMANLIKFQYAYQAAARLFTVADELLKSLLEAV